MKVDYGIVWSSLVAVLHLLLIPKADTHFTVTRTEGRRLTRPSWLVTYRDGLPVHRRSPILVLTGSDVAQLR